MTTSGIESYVQELSGGLESQGAGQFTLNKLTCSPALVQVSHQHPLRWLGFALQSAVLGGAVSARLGSNAASVGIEFDLTESVPEYLNPDLLLGEGGSAHAGARFLAQALKWAAAQDPVELHMICDGPHTGYHAVIKAGETKTQKIPPVSRRSRVALLSTFGERNPKRLQASAGIEGEMVARFSYLSVPLSLDSRPLPLGFPEAAQSVLWSLCPPAHPDSLAVVSPSQIPFAEIQVVGGKLSRFPPPPLPVVRRLPPALAGMRRAILAGDIASNQLRFEELRTTWNSLLVRQTPKGDWTLALSYVPKIPGTKLVRCDALLGYSAQSEPSRLVPVQHGMNLNPVALANAPAGWTVVAPASHLTTDFPGLNAVDDKDLDQLRMWAVAQIDQAQEYL